MKAEHVVAARPNGAVYFALEAHKKVTRQLEVLLGLLKAQAASAEFYDLPVIDARKHRNMVASAAVEHVKGEAQSLLREIGNILDDVAGGRKVRGSTVDRYLEETRRIGELLEEYRQATRDRLTEAGSDLDLLRRQVVALANVAE